MRVQTISCTDPSVSCHHSDVQALTIVFPDDLFRRQLQVVSYVSSASSFDDASDSSTGYALVVSARSSYAEDSKAGDAWRKCRCDVRYWVSSSESCTWIRRVLSGKSAVDVNVPR